MQPTTIDELGGLIGPNAMTFHWPRGVWTPRRVADAQGPNWLPLGVRRVEVALPGDCEVHGRAQGSLR